MATAGPVVTPKQPEALAVGRSGALYVVDTGRDEVLQRLSNGKFVVLAGDGKVGFSGDGGPARAARLDLLYSSGIAVGGNGTVYFTDAGNDRARAVLPNGTIETVAGGGTAPLGRGPLPAHEASLGRPYGGVAGLTIGRDGELYLATDAGVNRLAQNGDLYWVVGETKQLPGLLGGKSTFTGGYGVAVDSRGDVFVDVDASVFSSAAALVEIHPNGTTKTLWKLRELP